MATCVGKDKFVSKNPGIAAYKDLNRLLTNFTNQMTGASAAFSLSDGLTPLEVEMISLIARGPGSERAGEQGASKMDEERCENCVDLTTGPLEKGTDELKIEATVAAGLSAATAGILWLAVLSG